MDKKLDEDNSWEVKEVPKQVKDLTGQKFGKLKVLSFIGMKNGKSCWLCQCECKKKRIVVRGNLVSSNTKSCGCLRGGKQKHGFSKHELYCVWKGMMRRCYDPRVESYSRYGNRNIKVCDRWKIFPNFVKDMSPRPDGTTLDRIDNDGDYTPDNCRWATIKEQNWNSRNNRVVEYQGESRILMDWAKTLKLNYQALWIRLKKGWPVEKAFTTPIKQYEKKNQKEKRNK